MRELSQYSHRLDLEVRLITIQGSTKKKAVVRCPGSRGRIGQMDGPHRTQVTTTSRLDEWWSVLAFAEASVAQ